MVEKKVATGATSTVAELALQYAKTANLPDDVRRAMQRLEKKGGQTPLSQPSASLSDLRQIASSPSVGRVPVSQVRLSSDFTPVDPAQSSKEEASFDSVRNLANDNAETKNSRFGLPRSSDNPGSLVVQNTVRASAQNNGPGEDIKPSKINRLYGNLSYTFNPKFSDDVNGSRGSSKGKGDCSVSIGQNDLFDKKSFVKNLDDQIQSYREITGSPYSQEVVAMTSLRTEVTESGNQNQLIALQKRYALLSQIFSVLAAQLHVKNLSLSDPKSRLAAQAKTLRGAAIKERDVDVLNELLEEARKFARHFEEACNTPLDPRWKADVSLNAENRERKLEKLKQWRAMTSCDKANHLAVRIRPRLDHFEQQLQRRLAEQDATGRPELRDRYLKEGVVEAQEIFNKLVELSRNRATGDKEISDVLDLIYTKSLLPKKEDESNDRYSHAVLGPHIVSDALLYRSAMAATATVAVKPQAPMPSNQESSVQQKAQDTYRGLQDLEKKLDQRGNNVRQKIPNFDEAQFGILLERVRQLMNSRQVEEPDLRYLEEAQKLLAAANAP